MAKRQRNQRTVGNMLPYGKPEVITRDVLIEHRGKDGEVLWVTQSLEYSPAVKDVGAPENTKVDPVKRTKDFHHDDCHGKTGVDQVFFRDDRNWCEGCYTFKYGSNPWLEPELWGNPRAEQPAPLTIGERLALLETRKSQ